MPYDTLLKTTIPVKKDYPKNLTTGIKNTIRSRHQSRYIDPALTAESIGAAPSFSS
jgi:hypothetical protein